MKRQTPAAIPAAAPPPASNAETLKDWLRESLYDLPKGAPARAFARSSFISQVSEGLKDLDLYKLQDLARFVDVLRRHRGNFITVAEEFVRDMVAYPYRFGEELTPDIVIEQVNSVDRFRGNFEDGLAVAKHFNQRYPKLVGGGE